MISLTLFAFVLHASANKTAISFDPESPDYEETLFNYVNSLSPVILKDPLFLDQPTIGNNSLSANATLARGAKVTHSNFNLRKLKQLKLLVVGMMSKKMISEAQDVSGSGFGRYCFYGCHCLPDAEHSKDSKPFGTPIDAIDSTCKQMGVCYKCLESKYSGKKKQCKPEDTNYKYTIIEENGQGIDIECSPKNNECAQDVCLCDRKFAMDVTEHEHIWDPSFHSVKGNFVRDKRCKKRETSVHHGGNNAKPDGVCCGMDSWPNVSLRKKGEKCCGRVSYNDQRKECCNSKRSEITSLGMCNP